MTPMPTTPRRTRKRGYPAPGVEHQKANAENTSYGKGCQVESRDTVPNNLRDKNPKAHEQEATQSGEDLTVVPVAEQKLQRKDRREHEHDARC
jgi:hypothetical protein